MAEYDRSSTLSYQCATVSLSVVFFCTIFEFFDTEECLDFQIVVRAAQGH